MNYRQLLLVSVFCTLPTFALTLHAVSTTHAINTHKPIKPAIINTLTTQQYAQLWQLSVKEWTRYQILMQGPAGHWYRTLNPAEVLGILAENDSERIHYAELVVKQRKARIDHELAFNRAVHTAWIKLYPRLKPIRSFDFTPFQVNSASLNNQSFTQ